VVNKVTGFLRVIRFPLPIIPPTAPYSSSSSSSSYINWGCFNRSIVAYVPSGLSLDEEEEEEEEEELQEAYRVVRC
jgi:hypothetical protein